MKNPNAKDAEAALRRRVRAFKGQYRAIERRYRIPANTLAKLACGAGGTPTLDKILRVHAALDRWEARNE